MIDYSSSYNLMKAYFPKSWVKSLETDIPHIFQGNRWGGLSLWLQAIDELPKINASFSDFNSDYVIVGKESDCNPSNRGKIIELLHRLKPWRKGPFELFGNKIEAEWRSDLKWNRLRSKIKPLKNKCVLDVGCANGYHCYRMASSEAEFVLGIDPYMLFVIQFYVFQKYLNRPNICVLPIGADEMPKDLNCFDTVFSMGVLYHRRSPLEHLFQLKTFLKPNGQLVLESIVIDGALGQTLTPQSRYANMPNVWFIPSVLTLENWLKKSGFRNIECIDVSVTTSQEQRATDWSSADSLVDFLNPNDLTRTIEGYPAPKRAIFLAEK